MNRTMFRRILDLAMVILLPLQMGYSLIGEQSHEITGTVLLVLFLAHHILNRRWFATLGKGHYDPSRILITATDMLLCVVMLVLPVSGILMSKHLYTFLPTAHLTHVARLVHLLASYWGFLLFSFHLGLHWDAMTAPFRNRRRDLGRKGFPLLAILGLLIMGYGVYAFFARHLPDYLFLRTRFVYFDLTEPVWKMLADHCAILVLFAVLGHYLFRLLRHRRSDPIP